MEEQGFSFGPFVLIPHRQMLLRGDTRVPIGSRALDLLIQLVKRSGEVLDKQELIRLVWCGTFVDESNLKVNIAALRKVIDDRGAIQSRIATVVGRGYRFVEPVQTHILEQPEDAAAAYRALPDVSELLIGRSEIVRSLAEAAASNRLLTLVGAPGIGKSWLAIAVAKQLDVSKEKRVLFVDLHELGYDETVTGVIAKAVGLEGWAGNIEEGLIVYLKKREIFLILDGCDTRVDEAAAVASFLVSRCPSTRIVATSREPLRVLSERVHRVQGLASGLVRSGKAPCEVLMSAAVQLFITRYTEQTDSYRFSDEEIGAIAQICNYLDGVPLAIEFAAMLVRALGFCALSFFSTGEFLEFDGGMRSAHAHHRSVAASLDRSFDLLSRNEALVLARLSSLGEGFDLQTGLNVASDRSLSRGEATVCIVNLVSKSLIQRVGTAKAKFRIAVCVRTHAIRRFYAPNELEVYREASNRSWMRGSSHEAWQPSSTTLAGYFESQERALTAIAMDHDRSHVLSPGC